MNLDRISKPVVTLITALTALTASCTALWKAVDKTVERRSYEVTKKAIEDLRTENDELRKQVDHLVLEALDQQIEESSHSLKVLSEDAGAPVSSAPSPVFFVSPKPSSSAVAASASVAVSASSKPAAKPAPSHKVVVVTSLPSAAPRPPMLGGGGTEAVG